jgi:hypothetical protein
VGFLPDTQVKDFGGVQRNFEQINSFEFAGTGSPEGVVAAKIGATYRRIDGGAATSLYVKEADSGLRTGWVGK